MWRSCHFFCLSINMSFCLLSIPSSLYRHIDRQKDKNYMQLSHTYLLTGTTTEEICKTFLPPIIMKRRCSLGTVYNNCYISLPLAERFDEARFVTRQYVTNCYMPYCEWRRYVTKIFWLHSDAIRGTFCNNSYIPFREWQQYVTNCYIPFQGCTFSTWLWVDRFLSLLYL
jgi:hypothetical protein